MATETSKRDPNYVTTIMGVDLSTGLLPTKIYVDETTHRMLVSGTITGGSTIPATGATTAVTVQIVDGSGNQVTSFGGGTQYTDAGTPPANPVGPTLIWNEGGTWRTVSTAKPLPITVVGTPAVTATLAAETTKVIGTVRNADGAGNLWTSNSTTYTAKFGQDSNLLGTLGTAFSTAGKVDVIGSVGSSANAINVNQQTVNTTAVQLSASATVPTNGILVQALSTNGASIFVGGSGVTTSNGWELQPGQCIAFTCTLNTIYIRSAASTTDKVCYQVV